MEEGETAPDFELMDSFGKPVKLSTTKGETILFFYLRDNSAGCTREIKNFLANFTKLTALGYTILGVSPDSVDSHRKFKMKLKIPFKLLSDPRKTIIKKYGALGQDKNVLRKTYVLDHDLHILKIFDKVNIDNHVAQILEALDKPE